METLIYKKLDDNKVKCEMCNHFCVIKNKKSGICNVRENQQGILKSLVYDKIIAKNIDPIEKKPVFHLKPGSLSYSVATVGCNFKCLFCQNFNIAQMPLNNKHIPGFKMTPKEIVNQAVKENCKSISFTYTEPTIYFELALETAKLAKDKGLFNIFVTNGYMSSKALKKIAPFLDAANVDLKAFNEKFYKEQCKAKLEPVKENLKLMKSLKILVEITTLLIPGLNDDINEIKAMADFIAKSLGKKTPWHISRFYPCYKSSQINPTPVKTLKQAYKIGKDAGLRYVYTGNVAGLESENTFCHFCNKIIVKRYSYDVENFITKKGECPYCNTKVYGIF